ncbi:MAG: hypothetical protein IPM32_12545 [Ignavibacteriae bacterium]|nr:hypothetical protein [Ignavibacteriota bacterium]
MNSLIHKAKEFLELIEKLKKKGMKKKEIAASLNIPAPVLSSLYKTVLPKIAEVDIFLNSKELDEKLDEAFSLVNNLSKSKVTISLDEYLIDLKKLLKFSKNDSIQFDYIKNLKKHAEISYDFIKQNYQGIYYFYYVSTDSYTIKRDLFLIKENKLHKIIECFKGNVKSRVQYYGIVNMIGTHTLSLHASEKNFPPSEYLLINMSLPSVRNVEFFRGIFSSLTYARQPIARKFVMIKISDSTDDYNFNNYEVNFFDNENCEEIKEISEYLKSFDSKTECHLVTSPSFDIQDLKKELDFISQTQKV